MHNEGVYHHIATPTCRLVAVAAAADGALSREGTVDALEEVRIREGGTSADVDDDSDDDRGTEVPWSGRGGKALDTGLSRDPRLGARSRLGGSAGGGEEPPPPVAINPWLRRCRSTNSRAAGGPLLREEEEAEKARLGSVGEEEEVGVLGRGKLRPREGMIGLASWGGTASVVEAGEGFVRNNNVFSLLGVAFFRPATPLALPWTCICASPTLVLADTAPLVDAVGVGGGMGKSYGYLGTWLTCPSSVSLSPDDTFISTSAKYGNKWACLFWFSSSTPSRVPVPTAMLA